MKAKLVAFETDRKTRRKPPASAVGISR